MVWTQLTKEQSIICEAAVKYVNENKGNIANDLLSDDKYISNPALSVFMAGSPGAGKTELSKALLAAFSEKSLDIVRLDPDVIRASLPQYTGGNAFVFQRPISIAANYVFNRALKEEKNILFDTTFSNYDFARQNVSKSLKKNRRVTIVYSYVDPVKAWKFTQAREKEEGRKISKDVFIEALFNSRECVDKIKQEFGNRVTIYVTISDYERGTKEDYYDVGDIDECVNIPYSKSQLKKII